MATTAMDYENANPDRYEDEGARYERDRSGSPRGAGEMRDGSNDSMRRRSASPGGGGGGGGDRNRVKDDDKDDDGAINPGSNLFVTGIHPSLKEDEIVRLFEKYGEVEKCQIMRDPHSNESRGFGFVKMVTSDFANAARDGLQGEVIEGRTLSIEKARRARPRTPTPGKYFGPPKRGDDRRFGDRRRGPFAGGGEFRGGSRGYAGSGPRDDSYRGSAGGGGGYRDEARGGGYRDEPRSFRDEPRYESRGYRDDRYRDDRDRRDTDYSRGGDRFDRDRYRDDRYSGDRDRRGGGYNDRDGGRPRDGASNGAGGGGYENRESRDTYGSR